MRNSLGTELQMPSLFGKWEKPVVFLHAQEPLTDHLQISDN
jgi:hypothetical protein